MASKEKMEAFEKMLGGWTNLLGQVKKGVSVQKIDPLCYDITLDEGLHYEAFDARGQVRPWCIARINERATSLLSYFTEEFGADEMLNGRNLGLLSFVINSKLIVSEQAYDMTLPKQPIKLRVEYLHVTFASYTYRVSVTFPGQTRPDIVLDHLNVTLDPLSRKPTPFPKERKLKYERIVSRRSKTESLRLAPFPKAEEEGEVLQHDFKIQVLPSDIDPHLHSNNSVYTRNAIDIYVLSHYRKYGLTERGDPFRKVREVSARFKGEAKLGDMLSYRVWRDRKQDNTFHFVISKDSDVVNETTIEFYPIPGLSKQPFVS